MLLCVRWLEECFRLSPNGYFRFLFRNSAAVFWVAACRTSVFLWYVTLPSIFVFCLPISLNSWIIIGMFQLLRKCIFVSDIWWIEPSSLICSGSPSNHVPTNHGSLLWMLACIVQSICKPPPNPPRPKNIHSNTAPSTYYEFEPFSMRKWIWNNIIIRLLPCRGGRTHGRGGEIEPGILGWASLLDFERWYTPQKNKNENKIK